MNGCMLLLAAAALGVDYGWQPGADGQLEYIIQIEPVTLIALREGSEVVSQIDPSMRSVRRFRIRVGSEIVPRRGTPPAEAAVAAATGPAVRETAGVQYGWQPLDDGQMEFIVQASLDRLAQLRNGEDILATVPSSVAHLARVRVRCGSEALPRQSSVDSPRGQIPDASSQRPEEPATLIPAPAMAPVPAASQAVPGKSLLDPTGDRTGSLPSRWAMTDTATAPSTASGASDPTRQPGQHLPAGSHYQALADAAKRAEDGGRSTLVQPPGGRGPMASTPSPAGSQTVPMPEEQVRVHPAQPRADGPGGRQDRNARWPAASPDVAFPRTPPAEGTRQIAPLGDRDAGRGDTYLPFSTAANLPGWDDRGSRRQSLFDSSAPTADADRWAAGQVDPQVEGGDTLASALGYQTWPNRAVSYEVETKPTVALEDFWNDLADTANDRSLDYLRYESQSPDGDRPWWPLTLSVLALFASVGGNLYMGWITLGIYRRSLDLAEDAIETDLDDDLTDRGESGATSHRRHSRQRSSADR